MIMMSAIAIMTDVSVGRQCQLLIQHEGEDTAVWESMSIALPSVAPLTTAQHRAMSTLGRHERTTAHKRDSQPQTQTGKKSRCCEAQRCHELSSRSSVAECDVALCVDGVVTVL